MWDWIVGRKKKLQTNFKNAKTREGAEHILTKSQIFSNRRWWFLSQLQSCLNASQINLLQGEDLPKTFPEKWQRHIKQSVHPTLSILFFAVNFYQTKKEICFRMEVLRHLWFHRTKVGLMLCLVSHSLPDLWIAHLDTKHQIRTRLLCRW